MTTDEKWLTEHGYTQVTERRWDRRGWPSVTLASEGWCYSSSRDGLIRRATARELVQDVLFMRDAAARAAWDRAHARWQEACR